MMEKVPQQVPVPPPLGGQGTAMQSQLVSGWVHRPQEVQEVGERTSITVCEGDKQVIVQF